MPVNTRLTKLRVLGLEELERSKMLVNRWLLYGTAHDDHLGVDFEGYERQAGQTWMQAKFRGRGYVEATNRSIPFGGRRPTCHSMLVGETVDGYTALLLGTGRQPTMRFIGDDASTEAITALFSYADFWPVMAEARKLGGAMGAAAVLPEVRKGKMSLRAVRPEHLYIEWTEEAAWIPEVVIEQKRFTVEQLDKGGLIEVVEMWRTRAWDATHAFAYKDIPVEAAREKGAEPAEGHVPPDIELDGAPVEHRAGRCPIIWLQNTVNCDSPFGDPDCEPIFEAVEQLDRSISMVMRGSRANNDPTLVVSDTMTGRAKWAQRAKGFGRSMELSEKGRAQLLETQGRAIESSWLSVSKLEDRARHRVGTISPNPDNAGAYQSGVALQILHRTETSRAGERRNPLGVAICQLAQTVWAQCKELGIRTYGSTPGDGIELPPRELPRDPEADREEAALADHELGEGGVVSLAWPKLHEPIPEELRTVIDALAKGVVAGIVSREVAVGYAQKVLQSDGDVASEIEQIKKELDAKVEDFDAAMLPDVDEDIDTGLGDPGEAKPAGEDVQREALNGIQTKELGNTFARAGLDLAPETAEVVITEAYPAIELDRVQLGINKQIEFAKNKAEDAPEPPAPGEAPPEGVEQDIPEPREHEETEDQDEELDE